MSSVSPDRDGNIRGGSKPKLYAKITLVIVSAVTTAVFIAFCIVLGLLIIEKFGETNNNCESGNCHNDTNDETQKHCEGGNCDEVSCTVSGYTIDPVLGCYRFSKDNLGPKRLARERCAKDGRQLLLIDSALKASVALSILVNESSHGIWIQGTRTSVSSPWLIDDGDDLPYIGPKYREYASDPDSPPLELSFLNDNTFLGGPDDSYNAVICEM